MNVVYYLKNLYFIFTDSMSCIILIEKIPSRNFTLRSDILL